VRRRGVTIQATAVWRSSDDDLHHWRARVLIAAFDDAAALL